MRRNTIDDRTSEECLEMARGERFNPYGDTAYLRWAYGLDDAPAVTHVDEVSELHPVFSRMFREMGL